MASYKLIKAIQTHWLTPVIHKRAYPILIAMVMTMTMRVITLMMMVVTMTMWIITLMMVLMFMMMMMFVMMLVVMFVLITPSL